jgi:hypothetical protein
MKTLPKGPLYGTLVFTLVLLCLTAWLHDFFSTSGARTIYTAECADGAWRGRTCTGHLVMADRHRFKALKAHSEVLYWIAGSSHPSRKLEGCKIDNAKDWTCPIPADAHAMIATAMQYGEPIGQPGKTMAFHAVPKWKWLLLEQGASFFHEADN